LVGSKVGARVWLDRVPVLPAGWDYVRAGIAPGGPAQVAAVLSALMAARINAAEVGRIEEAIGRIRGCHTAGGTDALDTEND
jgi:hypothetical protein